MNLAAVRFVEPHEGGKPRDADIEVSSDGGQTWATLPTRDSIVAADRKAASAFIVALPPSESF